jgi:hypothetical protein
VVDTACTLAAATELTSVQLPITTFVNSAGVTQGGMNAGGDAYFVQNVGIGTMEPGFPLVVNAAIGTMQLNSSTDTNVAYYRTTNAQGSVVFGMEGGAGAGLASGTLAYNTVITSATGQSIQLAPAGTAQVIINSSGNVGIGTTDFGTSAVKVLAIGSGTAPTTSPADAAQMGVAEYNGGTGDVRLNIYGEASVAAKTAIGSGKVSINGTTGGFTRQLTEATSGALSGATGSIAVNVPSGARILGVQLRVDTAITSDNATKTWAAGYVNTPTTAITSGQVFDANTKFNAIHPAYEITTGTVTITITAAAGLFTGGVVRAICYYEAIDTMASL